MAEQQLGVLFVVGWEGGEVEAKRKSTTSYSKGEFRIII